MVSDFMETIGRVYEEVKVHAKDLADKVKDLIHEGNVRRIIIKDDHGNTFLEIPLSIATLGAIAAPVLAAVGAIATFLSNFTVVVQRAEQGETATMAAGSVHQATSGFGATDDLVNMKDTIGQRIDSRGTKLEDLAGTGETDTKGG